MKERFKYALTIIKLALLGAVLFFVGRHVAANWRAVEEIPPINVPSIIGACALAFCAYLCTTLGFQILLCYHGHRIPFFRTVGLVYIPMLMKYVPGKVWSVLSALHLFGREGIQKSIGLAVFLMATMLGLLAGLAVTALFGGSTILEQGSWLGWLAVALVLLAITHPPVFYGLGNAGLRLFNRPPIEKRLSWNKVLCALAVFCLSRIILGLAFVFLVNSFFKVDPEDIPSLIAVFILANLTGFIAIFAPGGIGVREGVLLVGLSPIVGPGPAIVVAGLARVWQTLLELATMGFGWLALSRKPGFPQNCHPG
jgi:uncharacterized membrane protein YbhN (UPF0104 family)